MANPLPADRAALPGKYGCNGFMPTFSVCTWHTDVEKSIWFGTSSKFEWTLAAVPMYPIGVSALIGRLCGNW